MAMRVMSRTEMVTVGIMGLATAIVMAVVGWGMTDVAMVGPRAAIRIAALMPQVETTFLFLICLPISVKLLRAESSPALRQALAGTWQGCRRAVWIPAGAHLKFVGKLLVAGGVVWVVAGVIGAGPSLGEILRVRLLLAAFAFFGIGLAVWARTVWPSANAALGACALVLVGMVAIPLAVAPVIAVVGPWKPLIQASMLLNPWIVMAGVSRLDILHMQWVYALSPLGAVEAYYPDLGLAIAVYGGTGVMLLILAVRTLRTSVGTGVGRE